MSQGSCLPVSTLGSTVCCSSMFPQQGLCRGWHAGDCMFLLPHAPTHGLKPGTVCQEAHLCLLCRVLRVRGCPCRSLLLLHFQNYFLSLVRSPLSRQSLLPAELLVITSKLRPDGSIPFQSKTKRVT